MTVKANAMFDDEEPPIQFSEAEKPNLPEEALTIVISAARRCYQFLKPATFGYDKSKCISTFIHTADCGMQVVQQSSREGAVDLARLSATIDLPRVEETLPTVVSAFEEVDAIVNSNCSDTAVSVMTAFGIIATKLYPGALDEDGVTGFRDIFASGEEL